ARDEDRDGVGGTGARDCALPLGESDRTRERAVRSRASPRNSLQSLPNSSLERRSLDVERQIELRLFTRHVAHNLANPFRNRSGIPVYLRRRIFLPQLGLKGRVGVAQINCRDTFFR